MTEQYSLHNCSTLCSDIITSARHVQTKMALTRVLLQPRKALENIARESCLFKSMVLGLIVFCLPMLTGCAVEGDFENGPPKVESIAQVDSADVSALTPEEDVQSGPPEAESIAQVDSVDVSTLTPEEDIQRVPSFELASDDESTEQSGKDYYW